jgi:mannose-1-phosphate guanylyltransferase
MQAPTQAVILAGGLGTRLGSLTARIPKPLVPVLGVPYLEHQLRLLARQSIRDVVLLTGYLGQAIEDHFGDGGSLGLSIRYSREPSPLGTGGALRLAAPLIADPFLVIYGDSYLPIDYREVLAALDDAALDRFPVGGSAPPVRAGLTGVVVVYDDREGRTSVGNNIAINDDGFVIRYDKDSLDDKSLKFVEAGVLAFRRSVIDLIPEGVVSLEKELFPQLIATRQLRAYPTVQRFYDIGTPDRLRAIEEYLSVREASS